MTICLVVRGKPFFEKGVETPGGVLDVRVESKAGYLRSGSERMPDRLKVRPTAPPSFWGLPPGRRGAPSSPAGSRSD